MSGRVVLAAMLAAVVACGTGWAKDTAQKSVPAGVPRGQYNVEVYLFRDGEVVSAQSTPLFIDQTGLERRLFNMAHYAPFYYGLACVAMAMMLGWISAVLFRRPD